MFEILLWETRGPAHEKTLSECVSVKGTGSQGRAQRDSVPAQVQQV